MENPHDSSKRSLLLRNSNKYASFPVGYSVIMKESYENLAVLLDWISYKDHNWMICGDLKIACMLLGQQAGYTKFPCFLCVCGTVERGICIGFRNFGLVGIHSHQ